MHHHVLHSGLEFAARWRSQQASEQKVEIALLKCRRLAKHDAKSDC